MVEVPRVFSSHLHGRASGNSETPFLPSSLLPPPLLPRLPAACSHRVVLAASWTPNPRQQRNQAASQLRGHRRPRTVDKGWLPKGEGERLNRKEARPETLFDQKIHQNQCSLACFLTSWTFKMKTSQVILFSRICSNLLHCVFEG